MKIIGILCVVCFATGLAWLTDKQYEDLKKYGAECSKEIGISIDTIKESIFGGDECQKNKSQCFAACVLKKTGIMNKDGTLSEDAMRANVPANVPQGHVDKVISKCIETSGDTDCEIAAEFLKCVTKTITGEGLS